MLVLSSKNGDYDYKYKLILVSNYPRIFLSKNFAYGFATIKGFSQTEASGATSN